MAAKCAKISEFMELKDVIDVASVARPGKAVLEAMKELKELFYLLDIMGVGDYCVFDPGIVRGLAYYTGVVFEVHDAVGELQGDMRRGSV